MLEYDPSRRINMAEALQHPFMQNLPADMKLSSKPREVCLFSLKTNSLTLKGVNRHQINAQSLWFVALNVWIDDFCSSLPCFFSPTQTTNNSNNLIIICILTLFSLCNLSIFAYMCILTPCHIPLSLSVSYQIKNIMTIFNTCPHTCTHTHTWILTIWKMFVKNMQLLKNNKQTTILVFAVVYIIR